jgi:WD40 repeat protein
VSPDLSVAAVGLDGSRVGLVDLRDGHMLWTAVATDGTVSALAFSPDGKTLASGGAFNDPDIRLWNVASGSETGRLMGHNSWISSLVFWPDGSKLASSSADQTVRVWDVSARKELDILRGHRNEVWRLALLPDGRTLVSGGKDGDVNLWDVSAPHRHQERITLANPINAWSFASVGRSIITQDRAGRVEKLSGLNYDQKELLFETGARDGGSFSMDSAQLTTKQPDNRIAVWDVALKAVVGKFQPATLREYPVGVLAHGKQVVTYSPDDNQNREWDLATQRVIQSWPSPAVPQTGNLSADERWSVIAGLEGNVIFLRDLPAQHTTRLDLKYFEPGAVNFSADGKYFVIASYLGYVRVWDTATWQERATLSGYRLGTHGAFFSRDGKRLATAGGSIYDTVKLWDTESWQDVLTLTGLGSSGASIAISGDGNVIASQGGSGLLQIWQAPTWEEIAAAENAPDGKSAAR